MEQLGVDPNAHSYCAAIAAHEQSARWRDALGLLAAMKTRAVPLDEHCVNAALAVCAAAGEADVATRLLRRCTALGVAPNVQHYTSVISCYARADRTSPSRWQQAMALLDEMTERGIHQDAAVHRALAHFDPSAYAAAAPATSPAPAAPAAPAAAPAAPAAPAAAAAAPDDGDDAGEPER